MNKVVVSVLRDEYSVEGPPRVVKAPDSSITAVMLLYCIPTRPVAMFPLRRSIRTLKLNPRSSQDVSRTCSQVWLKLYDSAPVKVSTCDGLVILHSTRVGVGVGEGEGEGDVEGEGVGVGVGTTVERVIQDRLGIVLVFVTYTLSVLLVLMFH